jgi:hypothetical protein
MNKEEVQQLLTGIEFHDGEADLQGMYAVRESLAESDRPRDAVPLLFEWFEQHPEEELGSPGPFVHFIEEVQDYHDLLVSSVERCPTCITVWMVNRLANGTEGQERERWVRLLKNVAADPSAEEGARESARRFVEYQRGI